MDIKVEKILAVGCNKRFAWFNVNGKTFGLRISDNLYRELRNSGVITSQALRFKNKR